MVRPIVPLDDDGDQISSEHFPCSIVEAVSWTIRHQRWPTRIDQVPGWWRLKLEEGDE